MGCSILAQLLCWFIFFYCLFYLVPAYKQVHKDFADVAVPPLWETVVSLSDFIVIYTCTDSLSDSPFLICLAGFLLLVIVVNLIIVRHVEHTRVLLPWFMGATVVPLILLLFEAITIKDFISQVVAQHPEILEYHIWWINLFA